MTVKSEFQQIPVDIFDEFGDVVLDGFIVQDTTVYAPGGATTPGETSTAARFIRDEFTSNEIANGIARTADTKFLTPFVELAIVPRPKDLVKIDSVRHNIVSVSKDPADALYTLYCTKA